MCRQRRGQLAVTDLFIAIFIFVGILISIFAAWNIYLNRLEQRSSYSSLLASAVQASDILVKSPGKPLNWELSNATVQVIGLAGTDRNLSTAKVAAFVSMDYNTSKDVLNIKRYNYKFRLVNINNSAALNYGENATGNFTVAIRRVVWYGNGTAYMDFILWK